MRSSYGFQKAMTIFSILTLSVFLLNIRANAILKDRNAVNSQEIRSAKTHLMCGMWLHMTGKKGVWDIPNVKANHPEKTEHPCQFPVELVQRCVLALTQPEGVVFDPYSGVGSTIIASLQHNRKAIAAELDSSYIKITRERVRRFADGELPLRPLGKPIHEPTGKERVTQVPLNFITNNSYLN